MSYLRFRKSVKICKGLNINLNKDSVGLSIGGKGFGYSINTKGTQTTHMGLPGSGLSYINQESNNTISQQNTEEVLKYNQANSELININKRCPKKIFDEKQYIDHLNGLEDDKREKFNKCVKGDEDYVSNYIDTWFNELELPFECNINYDNEMEKKKIMIDLDLPEIEDFPDKKAVNLTDGTMKLHDKTKAELNEDYKNYIFGLALFLVTNIFNVSPNIKNIVISGYTQRRDKSGRINNDYVYSIKFERNKLSQYDLKNGDSFKICMDFENACIIDKNNDLKVIVPYTE